MPRSILWFILSNLYRDSVPYKTAFRGYQNEKWNDWNQFCWPPKVLTIKTGINSMIYFFNIRGKLSAIRCYTWFFSMAKNRFYKPANINGFRSHSLNIILIKDLKVQDKQNFPFMWIIIICGKDLALKVWTSKNNKLPNFNELGSCTLK